MKNCFDVEVCFNDYPLQPFEWKSSSLILGVKLHRVNTEFLHDVLIYQGKILNVKGNLVLLSDTKDAVVLKLNNDGKIIKRSFLSFDKALLVSEMAYNMKISKIEFERDRKRVNYPPVESVEDEVKNYISKTVSSSKDEDFKRYIWYLYSDRLDGYSGENLLSRISESSLEVNMKLYKFLIES